MKAAVVAAGVLVAFGSMASAGDARLASSVEASRAHTTRPSPEFLTRDLDRMRDASRDRASAPHGAVTTHGASTGVGFSGEQRLDPVTTGEGGVADQFGTALAFDGTTLLVGAMQDLLVRSDSVFGARSGSVWVYRMAGLSAVSDGKLEPPDDQSNALFGFSVAVQGDIAIVGAPRAVIAGTFDRGAVYVFERVAGAWQVSAQLVAPVAAAREYFGWSVAISGSRIAVGAPQHDEQGALVDAGAAHIFDRLGGVWTHAATVQLADPAAGDNFGDAVALDGDLLLVGAPGRDVAALPDAGSVHAYVRSGDGTWPLQATITSPVPGVGGAFGSALALGGGFAFAGAPGEAVSGAAAQGAAYALARSGTTLAAPQRLTGSGGAVADSFGSEMSYDGTTLVVGAPSYRRTQGAGYVFTHAGGVFTETALLTRPSGDTANLLGVGVAVNGAITWLGANLQNVDPNRAQGVVQRFDRSGVAWSHAGSIDTADGAAEELFGFALAVDGDTLVSGAFLEDPALGLDDAGTATVFERVGGTWQRVVRLIAPDTLAEDQFGYSVAVRGDWIAVGAPQAIVNDQFNRGAVYLFERRAGAWGFAQKLTTASGLVNDAFGYSLAFDETGTRLVASVPGANFVAPDTGTALVFTRVGATWQLTQTVRPPRPVEGSLVGLRVALSSQVLALGAPDDSSLGDYTGRVHVYRWNGAQFDFAQSLETAERNSFEFFGNAVAVDGVRLAIGAPGRIGEDFVADRGAVYLIDDARTTTSPLREILPPVPQGGAYFGLAVALRGERLIVGAPGESGPGGELEGAAYVFNAGDGAASLVQKLQPQAGRAFEFYGNPLALSAETLAVGGPARGVINPREGSAYVYADDDPLFADSFE